MRMPEPTQYKGPYIYLTRRSDLEEDPQGVLGYFILLELLALPPAVLNAPVFHKVRIHLENYRKRYTGK